MNKEDFDKKQEKMLKELQEPIEDPVTEEELLSAKSLLANNKQKRLEKVIKNKNIKKKNLNLTKEEKEEERKEKIKKKKEKYKNIKFKKKKEQQQYDWNDYDIFE